MLFYRNGHVSCFHVFIACQFAGTSRQIQLLTHIIRFCLVIPAAEHTTSENEAEYAKHQKYVEQYFGYLKRHVGDQSESEQGGYDGQNKKGYNPSKQPSYPPFSIDKTGDKRRNLPTNRLILSMSF